MLISIIVPIYKVERYIRECIDSIRFQTYDKIEIILVDDGSPDNCPEICDDYARIDNRIRVIHKPNGGLSDARNAGLLQATGEYVIFIDSDDYFKSSSTLMSLMEVLASEPGLDVLGYNYYKFYGDSCSYTASAPFPANVLNQSDKGQIIINLVSAGIFPISACLKLIKRNFLIENNIYFPLNTISEDIPWFMNLYEKLHSIKFVNIYAYVYRQNVTGSITNGFSPKVYYDVFQILENGVKNVQLSSYKDEVKDSLMSFWAYEYSYLLANLTNMPRNEQALLRKNLNQYQYLLSYRSHPKVKLTSFVNSLLGIRMTEFLLMLYQKIR